MAKQETYRVLIGGGGTGGHVFPAIAVADELRSRGVEVSWMGTEAGMESRIVPQASIPIHYIKVSGLRGKGVLGWVMAPFKLTVAVFQAMAIVSKLKPVSVLGMGGFASGPGGVAAWLLRRPLVLHEQNAIIGMMSSTFEERILGKAEVREVFHVPKVGAIAGCYVTEGKVERGRPVRILRDWVVLYDGTISSLRRFKDDAKEVQSGYECGIGIENYNDVKIGDIIECYYMEEIRPELEQ